MKITKSQLKSIIQEEIQNVLLEKCWDGYTQIGMKDKGGRKVPNCVKKEGKECALNEEGKECPVHGLDACPVEEKKKKTDFSKEKKSGLHGWFSRAGGKGKSKGWVDCNTCRKDKKTGKKTCKSCGRSSGEKRAKYPHCRPTPSDCGTSKKSGKKSKAGKKG